jgi:hypothetical protein
MALRNRPRNDDSFDLDSYLEEKSSETQSSEGPSPQQKEKKPSNFFRNATLIVAATLASVLWYFDWNPQQAVAGIFGGSEPEIVVIDGTSDGSVIVIPEGASSEGIVMLENQAAEAARAAEIALSELNTQEIINTEEIERLTEQSVALALDAAFLALESLENFDFEGLEGLEGLEAIEDWEGFEITINEAALEALENIDFSNIQIQPNGLNAAGFDEYYRQFGELGITQFEGESIRSLYDAGVPTSFLSQLNEVGLLERLNAEEIIQIFQED